MEIVRRTKAARRPVTTLACSMVTLLVGGCATTFQETHYFQSLDPKTKTPTNYYRLKVSGYGAMSSARYVSGYYDERAVDLFFNEVKTGKTADDDAAVRKIFEDKQNNPGSDVVIKPLNPDAGNGVFVMILSTNASSVTRALGQFGENQVVADAITNLVNKETILKGSIATSSTVAKANATADELDNVMDNLPKDSAPDKEASIRALVRVLNTIASGMGKGPTSFQTFDEAEAWFAVNRAKEDSP